MPCACRSSRRSASNGCRRAWPPSSPPGELGYRLGEDEALSILALRAALSNATIAPEDLRRAEEGTAQRFPLAAADLAPLSGPALGQRLKSLERAWIDSGFSLPRDALLALP